MADLTGQASGIGPQMGGFAPTPGELWRAQMQAQSGMQLQQYALYTDPSARAAQGLLATAITGSQAKAKEMLDNSAAGQAIKDITAIATARGLAPGGNPANMMYGVQQMVGHSGMRLGGPGGGFADQFYGAGFVTDHVSRQMFDQMRSHFFSSTTGLGSTTRTHGMDKTQIGQILNMGAQRGAFAGMQAADLTWYGSQADIDRDKKIARDTGNTAWSKELNEIKPGQYGTKLNQSTLKKVQTFVEDTSAMLKDMKDVLGDLPIQELVQNAEALSGTDIGRPGAVNEMRGRISRLRSLSQAYGLNPQAVMQYQAQVAQATNMNLQGMYGGQASDYTRMSAAMAENSLRAGVSAYETGLEARNLLHDKGIHMRTISREEATAMSAYAQQRIAGEKGSKMKYALEASYYLSQGQIKDPQKVEALLEQLAGTDDKDTIKKLNMALAQEINASGLKAGAYVDREGIGAVMANMSDSATTKYSRLLQQQHRSRSKNSLSTISETVAGMGTTAASQEGMWTLFSNFDASTIDKLSSAVPGLLAGPNSREYAASKALIDKIAADNPSLGLSSNQIADSLRNTGATSERDLALAYGRFRGMTPNADFVDKQTELAAQAREVRGWMASNTMGTERLTDEGLLTTALRGMYGGGTVDKEAVLDYMGNTGGVGLSHLKLNEAGNGFNVSTEQAKRLMDTLGSGFAQSLGASSAEDVSKILGSPEGLSKMKGFLESSDNLYRFGVNTTGGAVGMVIANKEKAAAAQEKLLKDAEVEHYKTLTGWGADKLSADALGGKEGEALKAEAMKGVLSPERLNELVDTINKKGGMGSEMEALKFANKQGGGSIAVALKKQEEELRLKGDDKKAANVRAVRQEMEMTDDKFVGIVELVFGETLRARLFKDGAFKE